MCEAVGPWRKRRSKFGGGEHKPWALRFYGRAKFAANIGRKDQESTELTRGESGHLVSVFGGAVLKGRYSKTN